MIYFQAADVRSLLMDAMPPSMLPLAGLGPIASTSHVHIGGMLPLHPGLGRVPFTVVYTSHSTIL